MHRRAMVMERKRLNERVVVPKSGARRLTKLPQSGFALITAFNTAMTGSTESYVLVPRAKLPRRAMIVIASGNYAVVDFTHQRVINWTIRFQLSNPAVRR